MSARDIMPFKSPLGGTTSVIHGPLNASESFKEGELVGINSDGEVAEFPADGTPALTADIDVARIAGIAATPGDTTLTDGNAAATGDTIAIWPADQDTLFITDNVTDGSGTAVVPTGTMRGLIVQIEHNNGEWAVIPGAAATVGTHVGAAIVDVLNSSKNPISATDTTTGRFVVFRLQTMAAS